MRTSSMYYPDFIDFYCTDCDNDFGDMDVDGVDTGGVWVTCPDCVEIKFVNLED